MPEPGQAEGSSILGGLLDHVETLMGTTAGQATFRFAAHAEGTRVGSSLRRQPLAHVLERLDAMLDQRSHVEEEGPPVLVRVEASTLIERGNALAEGILLGAMEGLFGAYYGQKLAASPPRPAPDGHGHLVSLEVAQDGI
ncbi:MAG: hypothetical protein ACPGQL_09925 [Thermoplasmatota archaeon]